MKSLADNWQRFVFAIVGLTCLYYSFDFLQRGDVPNASAVFAISFLSFIYSNIARFKRFKGLGFEAELWEDKQKEAADLIERLKNVVSIYTSEVVLASVKRGRLVDGVRWEENWKLYGDLVNQHTALGQRIDFSKLKKEMDDYFLYDMTMNVYRQFQHPFSSAYAQARSDIEKEFGSVVSDHEGYGAKHAQLREASFKIEEPFKIAMSQNLAGIMRERALDCVTRFQEAFSIDVNLDEGLMARLAAISDLYASRPVEVTDELIQWANRNS